MAVKVFNCNLNGGDAITAKEDLTYRIYGSADNFTTPIATAGSHNSDANVTVTGDVVVIQNVNVGSEQGFKISALDAGGNESPLSDVFSTNKGLQFTGVATEEVSGALNTDPSGGAVTLEVRHKSTGANGMLASVNLSSNATGSNYGARLVVGSNGNEMRYIVGTGSAKTTLYVPIVAYDGLYHTYKLVVNADGSFEAFIDDVSKDSSVGQGALSSAPNLYIGSDGVNSSVIGTVDWVKVDSEVFELNEGAGTTITGSEGSTLTAENPNWVTI